MSNASEYAELLRAILTPLDRNVMLLRSGGFDESRSAWAEAVNRAGPRIRRGARSGVVAALDGLGAILLDTPDGQRERIFSGEITMVDGD